MFENVGLLVIREAPRLSRPSSEAQPRSLQNLLLCTSQSAQSQLQHGCQPGAAKDSREYFRSSPFAEEIHGLMASHVARFGFGAASDTLTYVPSLTLSFSNQLPHASHNHRVSKISQLHGQLQRGSGCAGLRGVAARGCDCRWRVRAAMPVGVSRS